MSVSGTLERKEMYIPPNLENTTTELPMYFVMLLPKEHQYVLVAPQDVDDFKKLIDSIKQKTDLDFTDAIIMGITRRQFLAAIDNERIKNSQFLNGGGGFAVNDPRRDLVRTSRGSTV